MGRMTIPALPVGPRSLAPAFAPWWLGAIVLATVLGFQRTLQGAAGLDRMHAIHGTTALARSVCDCW